MSCVVENHFYFLNYIQPSTPYCTQYEIEICNFCGSKVSRHWNKHAHRQALSFLVFFFFLFNFEQEHWTWYWFGCCCCFCCCYYDIVGKVERHALPVVVVQNKCFFLDSFVVLNFRYFAFFCLIFYCCWWWCCSWSLVNCYVEMMVLFKYNSNMMTMTGGCFV